MSKSLKCISSRCKVEAYRRIETILQMGPFIPGTRVVHRAYFLYSLRWSQVGARIHEMNDTGWNIASVVLPESEWQSGIRTGYRLDSKPLPLSKDRAESDYVARNDKIVMSLFAELIR